MFVKRTATFCSSSTRRGLHLVALNNGSGYKSRQRPLTMRIPTQHFGDVICNNNVQMINNSSSFSSVPSYDTSSSFSSNKLFKKVIRPFLRACHPDVLSSSQVDDDISKSSKRKQHPLSQQAKDTNLKAVQTLNGLIDVLDDLISRCTPPSYQQSRHDTTTKKSAASLPELNSRYEIEFILPPTTTTNTADDNDTRKPIKRKHRDKLALTLRSITISFPESLRSNVRQYALTTYPEEEAYLTAQQLKDHAMSELLRLLTIAGMSVPVDVINDQRQQGRDHKRGDQRKQKGQWTLSDHFLHELGIDPSTEDVQETPSQAFFGRTQSRPTSPHLRQGQSTAPPTYSHPQLQQQREAFMKSFQKVSHKFENDYDQAFLDAQADHTTSRLNLYNENTVEGRERREQLVSTICGGVRIWRAKIDDKDSDEDLEDEVPEGLDVVAQLIAIRRLSLILYDNFDYLKMEKMGRMYEQLTIVLTPPRNNLTSRRDRKPQKMLREDGTRIHPGRKLNKWERNKKKRDRLQNLGSRGKMRYIAEKYLGEKNDDDTEDGDQEERKPSYQFESGFRFSYGTQSDQGIGKVTAYIPVDFRDGELVRQMYTHLYDYFDNCCGKVGWLSYGTDGNIKANMEDDDYTSGMRHQSSN